jgi:hypothetical protein
MSLQIAKCRKNKEIYIYISISYISKDHDTDRLSQIILSWIKFTTDGYS